VPDIFASPDPAGRLEGQHDALGDSAETFARQTECPACVDRGRREFTVCPLSCFSLLVSGAGDVLITDIKKDDSGRDQYAADLAEDQHKVSNVIHRIGF
jgi:hypothetical protein